MSIDVGEKSKTYTKAICKRLRPQKAHSSSLMRKKDILREVDYDSNSNQCTNIPTYTLLLVSDSLLVY